MSETIATAAAQSALKAELAEARGEVERLREELEREKRTSHCGTCIAQVETAEENLTAARAAQAQAEGEAAKLREENAALKAKSESRKVALGCNHCGDDAIESETGWFQEDDGTACMSCGFPGHVDIVDGQASWSDDDADGNVCTRPDCEECKEHLAWLAEKKSASPAPGDGK